MRAKKILLAMCLLSMSFSNSNASFSREEYMAKTRKHGDKMAGIIAMSITLAILYGESPKAEDLLGSSLGSKCGGMNVKDSDIKLTSSLRTGGLSTMDEVEKAKHAHIKIFGCLFGDNPNYTKKLIKRCESLVDKGKIGKETCEPFAAAILGGQDAKESAKDLTVSHKDISNFIFGNYEALG